MYIVSSVCSAEIAYIFAFSASSSLVSSSIADTSLLIAMRKSPSSSQPVANTSSSIGDTIYLKRIKCSCRKVAKFVLIALGFVFVLLQYVSLATLHVTWTSTDNLPSFVSREAFLPSTSTNGGSITAIANSSITSMEVALRHESRTMMECTEVLPEGFCKILDRAKNFQHHCSSLNNVKDPGESIYMEPQVDADLHPFGIIELLE